ncbi:beta strand repeat-containing protein, partial [Flavobacterium sp. '19STA2R22 D10 B1']|uniref:beta strand repeat-containing protein n=1 Tax=Flavobacterium aerium TaxID=3037261 RepID=UPI0035592354
MKKNYIITLLFLLVYQLFSAQTTETFEDETAASMSFTDNGQVFNITSQAQGPFDIQAAYPGSGWNGISADNKYIDNDGHASPNVGVQFTISSAGATVFQLKSLYLYIANSNGTFPTTGTCTITGKLAGTTVFTASASTGFNISPIVNNGFTLIDMLNYGGADNSSTSIDQYIITTTGSIAYIALDAMKWQKFCTPVTVTPLAQTNVSCNGGNNGSASVMASGGTGFTYNWTPGNPTGDATPTVTGLTPGLWTCTVTNSCGNSNSTTFTITQPSLITATTSQTNVSCNGTNNGVASVTTSGGTGTYTYSWAPSGGTAATASGLTAGAYTVTIKDANLCTITKNFTITQPPAITATMIQTDVSCNGANNGSASVIVSGGTPFYTYSWAPTGGTAATASGLTAGNYTVTITDLNLCTLTKTFTITQPSLITATTGQTNVSCNGGTDGSATVTVSGGTPNYTYSWAPTGGAAPTASGLTPGVYTVTITDLNSCTLTKSFTITQPSLITATTTQNNVSCNGSNNGSATVTVSGGTPNYTYSWAPSGGTAATASGLTAGVYTVTIKDANLCSITKNFIISQPSLITATTTQNNVSCNGSNDGSATVTVSGGTPNYTYSWAPSGGTAATASGLTAGAYTVTIKDANLCSITKNFIISQPAPIAAITTQNNVSCNGGNNGSATVTVSGGTPNYTYSWAPSGGTAATASGLVPGIYTVTITDANLCSITKTFTITQPAPIVATTTQNNVSCNGNNNGSATVTVSGGTPTYTYSWAPTGGTAATASGLTAGNYTVTITDANNCTTTQNFTINEPTPMAVTAVQTDVPCNGGSNGSATVTVSGGTGAYTYSWAPTGGTAATASGLTVGNYTVTITDANNCTTTQNFTINEPTPMDVTAVQTDVPCNGGSNGSATVTVSGGTGAYTYSWAPSGGTAATASGLTAGNYTVTITDANNCTTTQNFTINEPTPMAVTAVQTDVPCNGGSNGSATVTVSGGTGAYTYSWSPSGGTAATASGLTAGNYTVTITDANNCTTTQNFTINEPTPMA